MSILGYIAYDIARSGGRAFARTDVSNIAKGTGPLLLIGIAAAVLTLIAPVLFFVAKLLFFILLAAILAALAALAVFVIKARMTPSPPPPPEPAPTLPIAAGNPWIARDYDRPPRRFQDTYLLLTPPERHKAWKEACSARDV